jgi:hypothetical protein
MDLEKLLPNEWHSEPFVYFFQSESICIDSLYLSTRFPFKDGMLVRLYHHKRKRVIGIEPVKDRLEYFTTKKFSSRAFEIGCKDFLDKHGIPYQYLGDEDAEEIYPTHWSRDGKVFLINLAEKI